MTIAEVRQVYPTLRVPLSDPSQPITNQRMLEVNPYSHAGCEFRVWFFFPEGGLNSITASLNGELHPCRENIRSELVQQYGAAAQAAQLADDHLQWTGPLTNVTFNGFGRPEVSFSSVSGEPLKIYNVIPPPPFRPRDKDR